MKPHSFFGLDEFEPLQKRDIMVGGAIALLLVTLFLATVLGPRRITPKTSFVSHATCACGIGCPNPCNCGCEADK